MFLKWIEPKTTIYNFNFILLTISSFNLFLTRSTILLIYYFDIQKLAIKILFRTQFIFTFLFQRKFSIIFSKAKCIVEMYSFLEIRRLMFLDSHLINTRNIFFCLNNGLWSQWHLFDIITSFSLKKRLNTDLIHNQFLIILSQDLEHINLALSISCK